MIDKKGWEKKKLGEICTTTSGGTPNRSNNSYFKGTIPWVKSGELDKGLILDTEEKITEEALKNSSAKVFPKGTLLIALYGATIGKLAFLGIDACTNQAICGIYKNDNIDSNFLYYFLYFKKPSLINKGIGGGQPNISQGILKDLKIPVPPLPIQQQIVSELDTLNDIISKKKKQLVDLDALAQATFYDMFGDPVSNEKAWEKGFLKDHTTKIGSGATPNGGNQNYKSEGISLIRSLNVHNGKFLYKDLAYIDDEQAKQLNNVTIQENDVLINITGASVARSCIVPKEVIPARVNQHVSIIRLKDNLNSVFVNALFISPSYQEKLLNLGKVNGATREAITKSQLEILDIPIPPISLQNKFTEKIESITEQKGLINKSIVDVQQLFDYTMDRYFN